MKENTGNVLRHFVVELVDVKDHGEQEGFCEDIGFAAPQEASESTILLQNSEGTFSLDRAVDS